MRVGRDRAPEGTAQALDTDDIERPQPDTKHPPLPGHHDMTLHSIHHDSAPGARRQSMPSPRIARISPYPSTITICPLSPSPGQCPTTTAIYPTAPAAPAVSRRVPPTYTPFTPLFEVFANASRAHVSGTRVPHPGTPAVYDGYDVGEGEGGGRWEVGMPRAVITVHQWTVERGRLALGSLCSLWSGRGTSRSPQTLLVPFKLYAIHLLSSPGGTVLHPSGHAGQRELGVHNSSSPQRTTFFEFKHLHSKK